MRTDVFIVYTLLISHFQSRKISLHRAAAQVDGVGGEEFAYWEPDGTYHDYSAAENREITRAVYSGVDQLIINGRRSADLQLLRNSNIGARIVIDGYVCLLIRKLPLHFQYWNSAGRRFQNFTAQDEKQILRGILYKHREIPLSRGRIVYPQGDTATCLMRYDGNRITHVIRKPTGKFMYSISGSTFFDFNRVKNAIIANAIESGKKEVNIPYDARTVTVTGLQSGAMRFKNFNGELGTVKAKPVPTFTVSFSDNSGNFIPFTDEVNQIIRAAVYAGYEVTYYYVNSQRYKIEGLDSLTVLRNPDPPLYQQNTDTNVYRALLFKF